MSDDQPIRSAARYFRPQAAPDDYGVPVSTLYEFMDVGLLLPDGSRMEPLAYLAVGRRRLVDREVFEAYLRRADELSRSAKAAS